MLKRFCPLDVGAEGRLRAARDDRRTPYSQVRRIAADLIERALLPVTKKNYAGSGKPLLQSVFVNFSGWCGFARRPCVASRRSRVDEMSSSMATQSKCQGDASLPELLIVEPGCDERRISLPRDNRERLLGRSRFSDVRLADEYVSARHAAFRANDQQVFVTDVGSKLGTFVNGRRIEREAHTAIKDSDEVRVGETVVRVVNYADKLASVFAALAAPPSTFVPPAATEPSSTQADRVDQTAPSSSNESARVPSARLAQRQRDRGAWVWPAMLAVALVLVGAYGLALIRLGAIG